MNAAVQRHRSLQQLFVNQYTTFRSFSTVHTSTPSISLLLDHLTSTNARDEVTARRWSDQLRFTYSKLDRPKRHQILRTIAEEYSVEASSVASFIEAYQNAVQTDGFFDYSSSSSSRDSGSSGSGTSKKTTHLSALECLRNDLSPPYERLLSRVAREDGLPFLLEMRKDLLEALSHCNDDANGSIAALKGLDSSLKRLLEAWFSVGLLELRRITYEESGGGVLEKIARGESVHKVRGLEDLKTRLGHGRRCYAFFHPCVPHEPLIFVHVALLPEIATSLDYINKHSGSSNLFLSHDLQGNSIGDDSDATTAIFYSINATQPGLRGVELGNSLIKRVVQTLRGESPRIRTFCTLSPIPGLWRWLSEVEKDLCVREGVQSGSEGERLGVLFTDDGGVGASAILSTSTSLRSRLLRLTAQYLVQAKKPMKNGDETPRALDPVAHFHLRNGATVHSINWAADLSVKGRRNSAGIMVNYKYNLNEIAGNSDQYANQGHISLSLAVESLLEL